MSYDLLEYIKENADWIFSGIGVATVVGLCSFFEKIFNSKNKDAHSVQISQTNAGQSTGNQIFNQCEIHNYIPPSQDSTNISQALPTIEDSFFSQVSEFIAISSHTREEVLRFATQFASDLNKRMDNFSLSSVDVVTSDILEEKISAMRQYRDAYLKVLEHLILRSAHPELFAIEVIELYLQYVYAIKCNYSSQKEHYRFFLWDIFLSSATMMMFYQKYDVLAMLLKKKYVQKDGTYLRDYCDEIDFTNFELETPILNNKSERKSHAAEILISEEFGKSITQNNIIATDVILCQISTCLYLWEKSDLWIPSTFAFYRESRLIRNFWTSLKSRKECEKVTSLFDVEDIFNLKSMIENVYYHQKDGNVIKGRFRDVPTIAHFIYYEDVASES